MNFVEQCGKLERSKGIRVVYGIISPSYFRLSKEKNDGDLFVEDDPMIVLMEFARIQVATPRITPQFRHKTLICVFLAQNIKLADLFTSLDADKSQSLSLEEFQRGLMVCKMFTSEFLKKYQL